MSQNNVISHASAPRSLEDNIAVLEDTIADRGDLPYASIEKQLELLHALSGFPLGRFLIQNRGLNGYWTDYIVLHPQQGRVSGVNSEGEPFSELESWILNRCPVLLATQERFGIFCRELAKRCTNGARLASVPCGYSADLLQIDYSPYNDIKVNAADIDHESLEATLSRAEAKELGHLFETVHCDAWEMDLPEQVDVLASNGLNLYEPDNERLLLLYQRFCENIKPGGTLIVSTLTPPPLIAPDSEWRMDAISTEDAIMQRLVLKDLLLANWQNFRSTAQTIEQLEEVGFVNPEVHFDQAGLFPTITAQRAK